MERLIRKKAGRIKGLQSLEAVGTNCRGGDSQSQAVLLLMHTPDDKRVAVGNMNDASKTTAPCYEAVWWIADPSQHRAVAPDGP